METALAAAALPLPAAKSALPPPRSALHEAEAGQTCAFAQARPASLNDQVTAMRGRQLSLASASTALPAVRPTAAQSRGARPLLRPGSWGRMAAPYNEATLKSSQYARVFVDVLGFTSRKRPCGQ